MIVETANLRIKPGSEDAFEAAFVKAVEVFRQAKGCQGLHLQRCIEEPDLYQAVIHWDTLEDHTEGFRSSPLFQEWRGLVSAFFAEPPKAIHFDIAVARTDF